jgi:hypothetical protein
MDKSILVDAGLDWTVRTERTQTIESKIILPEMAIIREGETPIHLGTHKEGYQPFQNHELLDLLTKISNHTGLELHRGGMFGEGRKVFIQLKSDDLRIGNDKIKGFVTGINSFDGSTSLGFGHSNVTISCSNTFHAAFRTLDKIRHTKNMMVKIEEVLQQIDVVMSEEKEIFANIKRMSEHGLTEVAGIKTPKEIIDMVTRQLFNIKKEINLNDLDAISTQTRNKMISFEGDVRHQMNDKGENLWGLFSGVTKYTTETMKTKSNEENKMFGTYGKRERQIFNQLVGVM